MSAVTSLGRLLIVDDEEPVRDVLGEYFSSHGYQVDTAGTGAEALDLVRSRRPDLVLLDVRMPGLDGVEVLKRLREVDGELPVIMITANEDVALARSMLSIGAFDYVSKPFDFRYLDRVVTAALVQTVTAPGGGPRADAAEPWRRLAVQVFQAVRDMPAAARTSTGARLEEAVLEAAREAGQGRPAAAWLDRIDLLLEIAGQLGDLTASTRSALERAVEEARMAPRPA
ncbi:MAG: response regulator [Candidatus Rokubacteria bacterium]|nr:response regulator [Candidatus Rokubacteria bacterium]